jgi:hypothetical protein
LQEQHLCSQKQKENRVARRRSCHKEKRLSPRSHWRLSRQLELGLKTFLSQRKTPVAKKSLASISPVGAWFEDVLVTKKNASRQEATGLCLASLSLV